MISTVWAFSLLLGFGCSSCGNRAPCFHAVHCVGRRRFICAGGACRLAGRDEWFGVESRHTVVCSWGWRGSSGCAALSVLLPSCARYARLYHPSRRLLCCLKYVVFLALFSSAPCDVMNNAMTFCTDKPNVTHWLIALLGERCFSSLPRWVLLSESCIIWNGEKNKTKRVLVQPISMPLHTSICYSGSDQTTGLKAESNHWPHLCENHSNDIRGFRVRSDYIRRGSWGHSVVVSVLH